MADAKEIAAELLSRFNYADSWRQQYDEKAVEWYKLYVGYREPLPEELQGRSNLHIPRTYEQLDTLRSRLVKAFFSIRPYIDFMPQPTYSSTPEAIQLNAQKAQLAAALVDMQLERNQIVRRFYDFITSLLVFPAAIMGVGWRYERKQVKRRVPVAVPMGIGPDGMPIIINTLVVQDIEDVIWDDNELVNVDYFDFWPDPRGHDIDSCRFVFQREWLTQEQIEEKLMVLERAGSGEIYPVDWEAIKGAGQALSEGRWERLSAVGLTPETSDGYYSEEGEMRGKLFEVLHYWEDERHAIIINRSELAYDGANPYWRHGKKPFVVATFEPLPNEFYGMSAVQIIEHLQEELNTHRNQRIDNVSLVLNRMWKVRRSADIEEAELVSRPHGILYVDNPDDVTEMITPDVTASAYTEEAVLKQDMENALGVPAVVRGTTPSRRETATEVITKSSNASIRFDVKIMLFETLGIKRMAYLMDCNNQQFIDQPRLVRLFGQEDPNAWQMIEPGQLVGEWDYRPSGSNIDPAANKEIRRNQLNQVMAVVLQTNNPYVDKYELTKMWLEAYDIRNVEKLLIPKEQLLAQIQAVQQMQGAGPVMPTTPQVPGMGPGTPTTPATVAPGMPP